MNRELKNNEIKLAIFEWNIDSKKSDVEIFNEIQKRINKIEIPIIFVLTECRRNFDGFNKIKVKENMRDYWYKKINSDSYNPIGIFVFNDKKNQIEKVDEITVDSQGAAIIHPNRIAIELTFSNKKKIKVMGVRFLTSFGNVKKYKNDPRKKELRVIQNKVFIDYVRMISPDIVVGDFNYATEMKPKLFYSAKDCKNLLKTYGLEDEYTNQISAWCEMLDEIDLDREEVLKKICALMNKENEDYRVWPDEKRSGPYSKKTNAEVATSPDKIFWNNATVTCKRNEYYPKNKIISEFEPLVPSDHACLKAIISIKE